ncbi:MAG: PIN domain-containing protein [Candidatus Micrarchaeota archaeon]
MLFSTETFKIFEICGILRLSKIFEKTQYENKAANCPISDLFAICGVCGHAKQDIPYFRGYRPENEKAPGNTLGGDSKADVRGKACDARLDRFRPFKKQIYGRRRYPHRQADQQGYVCPYPQREGKRQVEVVIDANILLGCFSKNSFTRRLILQSNLNIYAPDFLLFEYGKYREEIFDKSEVDFPQLGLLERLLFDRLKIISRRESLKFEHEAKTISPDPDDFRYFELALALGFPIWSNDAKLKNQEKVLVLNTPEIAELLQ